MQQVVSITSQGQVTIPRSVRNAFGISGSVKAVLKRRGDVIEIRPARDFWSLSGSLGSRVKLSDEQLRRARRAFSKSWGSQ